MTGKLAPGDPAPGFTLPDADGRPVSLSAYRGQRVIVYFYPAAMTPGCTAEACDFRDSLADLAAAGIAVLAISPDPPAKLAKFRDKEGLTFPLLSDPDHAVHEAYGAYGEKKLYGRTTVGVIRSTFLVGPDGTIAAAWYGVKAAGHVARLRAEIGALPGRRRRGELVMVVFGEREQMVLQHRQAAGREAARAAIGRLASRPGYGGSRPVSHGRPRPGPAARSLSMARSRPRIAARTGEPGRARARLASRSRLPRSRSPAVSAAASCSRIDRRLCRPGPVFLLRCDLVRPAPEAGVYGVAGRNAADGVLEPAPVVAQLIRGELVHRVGGLADGSRFGGSWFGNHRWRSFRRRVHAYREPAAVRCRPVTHRCNAWEEDAARAHSG
jgi:peroxiredoxin Q/BCP